MCFDCGDIGNVVDRRRLATSALDLLLASCKTGAVFGTMKCSAPTCRYVDKLWVVIEEVQAANRASKFTVLFAGEAFPIFSSHGHRLSHIQLSTRKSLNRCRWWGRGGDRVSDPSLMLEIRTHGRVFDSQHRLQSNVRRDGQFSPQRCTPLGRRRPSDRCERARCPNSRSDFRKSPGNHRGRHSRSAGSSSSHLRRNRQEWL